LIGFLIGIVCGFFIAPVKKGISVGSNNTIAPLENDEDEEDETPKKSRKCCKK
jgi:hypothetical protein